MTAYIVRRVIHFIALLLIISLVGFFAVRFTGDPLAEYMPRGGMSPEAIQVLRAKFGMDKPVIIQYGYWLVALLQGDWGNSFVTGQPVLTVVLPRLGNTALLLASILVMTLILAIPIGIYCALKPHSFVAYFL